MKKLLKLVFSPIVLCLVIVATVVDILIVLSGVNPGANYTGVVEAWYKSL